MSKYIGFIGSLFTILLVSACAGLSSEPQIISTLTPRPTIDPASVDDLGAVIFADHCAACHGEMGLGDGAVAIEAGLDTPNFTSQQTSVDQSLTQWTNTIRYGRIDNMMPPWENSLSDAEIEAVAEYTYTLWENFDQAQFEQPHVATTEEAITAISETQGTISGEVLHGTSDGQLPNIISVALQVIDTEGNEAHFEMQVLEDDMTYTFEDVLIRLDHTYFVTAIYNDVVFYSDIRFGTPETPQMELPVTIYDTTSDESVIEVDMFLMRLIPDEEGVIVQQLVNFHNTSDRVYRGENQLDSFTYDSVRLPLPDEAKLLNTVELIPRFMMLDGEEHQTLLDTQPVLPDAEHTVEVVYSLPISLVDAQHTFDLPIRYPVTAPIELMTQPSQYRIVSDAFKSEGTQHFSVGVYESYVSQPLSANSSVQFNIQIAPSDNADDTQTPQNTIVIVMILVGGGLMLVSVIFFVNSYLNAPNPNTEDPAGNAT